MSEPSTPRQLRGTEIHQQLEDYLLHGKEMTIPAALSAKRLVDEFKPRVCGVEQQLSPGVLTAQGISFDGYMDLVLKVPDRAFRIVDWKTTGNHKNVRFKGPTIQQLGYAEHQFRKYPSTEFITSSYIYLEDSENPPTPIIKTVELRREQCAEGWTTVEETVKQMVDVASETDTNKVPCNLKACRVGPNVCAFASICPKEGVDIMSLFDDLMIPATKTETKTEAAKESAPLILPPDVPAVQEVVATQVATEVATKVEEPKKRGRPAGSKNRKMEIQDVGGEATIFVPQEVVQEAQKVLTAALTQPVKVMQTTKVTVRHGLTINMGNYQSARVEVELEALVGGDSPEAVREQLGVSARNALNEECKPYLEKIKVAEKKP